MTLTQIASRNTRSLSLMMGGIGAHFLAQAWEAVLPSGSALRLVPFVIILMALAVMLFGAAGILRTTLGSSRAERVAVKADEWHRHVGHRAGNAAFVVALLTLAVFEVLPAARLPEAETVVRVVFGIATLGFGLALWRLDRMGGA